MYRLRSGACFDAERPVWAPLRPMLFNESAFLVFLPVVLLAFHLAPRGARPAVLLAASYFFYGWWDWRYLGLLVLSSSIDFYAGRAMSDRPDRERRRILIAALAANLGILGLFKYFDFFARTLHPALQLAGITVLDGAALHLVLPIGISFYTFQSMSYSIDVYRRSIEPCRSPRDFALYVVYFPQLVAGPIERYERLMPSLLRLERPAPAAIRMGITLALTGAFKKVVVGDTIAAPYANHAFAHASTASGPMLAFGLAMFSLQIYADFSGYSDIARGVSRFFGVELMANFDQPYLSQSITDFWRRWHISLSTWLRDYLYIPLGGNRGGAARTYVNLMLTMLIGGLWHGASWTFVVWGGLHGLYLAAHKALGGQVASPPGQAAERRPLYLRLLPALGRILLTNVLVMITWIFFRAPSFDVAWTYLARLPLAFSTLAALRLTIAALGVYGLIILALDLLPYLRRRHEVLEDAPWPVRGVAYAALTAAIWVCWPASYSPFIYFQF